MTRPFSQAYKQKMIERLSGKDAVSARQASQETGISQETLSRWLRDARSLPLMAPRKRRTKPWSDRWGIHNDLTLFNPAPVT